MNDTIEETEEEAAARVLAWRAQRALGDAPELMAHMRELIPTPERGEFDRHMWAPMRLTPTDEADQFYANIINWVLTWAEYLTTTPPSSSTVAWANDREVQGFRANTTPQGALVLTRLQTNWLIHHFEEIQQHEHGLRFCRDLVDEITALRGRYPVAPRRPRPVSLRPCPYGHLAVGADWMGYELTYVEIRCEHCGWVADTPKPSEIIRWLKSFTDTNRPLSQECEAGDHAPTCESLTCTCWCHDWAASTVGHGQETPVRVTGSVPRIPASTAIPDQRVCKVCWLYHPEGACQG